MYAAACGSWVSVGNLGFTENDLVLAFSVLTKDGM